MIMDDKLAWVMIFVAAFTIITAVVQYADAELYLGKYAHPHPGFEYYEKKYAAAKASQMYGWIPEPLPQYRLDAIKTIQCDSWKLITGQIPTDTGVLMSMAVSEASPHHIVTSNYGYTGFVGYLHIPCNEATLGTYNVYFNLWESPTVWRTDFIEEPQNIKMTVEVTP